MSAHDLTAVASRHAAVHLGHFRRLSSHSVAPIPTAKPTTDDRTHACDRADDCAIVYRAVLIVIYVCTE